MSWNPQSLIKAAQKSGIDYEVDGTWLKVDPYGKGFQPVGVVWHHTACGTFSKGNMPSLNWCRFPGQYSGKARACHIVVGRDGKFQIIAGRGAYHAGVGGPMTVNGKSIPRNLGNRYLIGIEIEASSTSKVNKKNRETPKSGMNPAQFEAVAKYCAALFDALGWETDAAIRHQDWAPGRKVDVGIPLKSLRDEIEKYRKKFGHPQPEEPEIKPVVPPVVKLSNIKFRKRHDHVLIVKEALNKEFRRADLVMNPYFGMRMRRYYSKWQKSLGYKGKDADGFPGRDSLTKLGKKHGFKVI